MEKQALEEARVKEEERVRAVKDRQRNKERAEKGTKEAKNQQDKNQKEIDSLKEKMNSTTINQKDFLALEQKVRSLIDENANLINSQKDARAFLETIKAEEDAYKAEEDKRALAAAAAANTKWFADYDAEKAKEVTLKAAFDAADTAFNAATTAK